MPSPDSSQQGPGTCPEPQSSSQAWPGLRRLRRVGKNGTEEDPQPSLQPRRPKHTPLDTPTTHSTSLYTTATHTDINTLSPQQTTHTPTSALKGRAHWLTLHSSVPPLHHSIHQAPPEGLPGVAREGSEHSHREQTGGVCGDLEVGLPHQTASEGDICVLIHLQQEAHLIQP